MARLTVKWLRDEMTATMSHYWSDLVRRERQLKDYCDQLYYRLDFQANAISVESVKISEQSKKLEQLTQLAAQQAELIEALTSKLEELAESHNRLQERELQTFTLSSSNAKRIELHGTWIRVLFNRINENAMNDE